MGNLFGELWDDGKRALGAGLNDGAHLIGDGLNAVGLHGAAQTVDTLGDQAGYHLGADVAELQLGETTDPAELVHGDPAAIRSSASKLRTFSGAFGETASGLRGLDTGHWTGAAADAFRAKFAPQPARWQDAASATGSAAGALESYAGAVESAQGQARQAITLYEQGQQASAAAQAAYNTKVAAYDSAAQAYNTKLASGQDPGTAPTEPGAFSDPGQAMRQQAAQILGDARGARDAAAAAAASATRPATVLDSPATYSAGCSAFHGSSGFRVRANLTMSAAPFTIPPENEMSARLATCIPSAKSSPTWDQNDGSAGASPVAGRIALAAAAAAASRALRASPRICAA